MTKSEVCEKDYHSSFQVTASVGELQTFDSFACAIHPSPQHVFTESVALLDIDSKATGNYFVAPISPNMQEAQNFTTVSDLPSAIREEAGGQP